MDQHATTSTLKTIHRKLSGGQVPNNVKDLIVLPANARRVFEKEYTRAVGSTVEEQLAHFKGVTGKSFKRFLGALGMAAFVLSYVDVAAAAVPGSAPAVGLDDALFRLQKKYREAVQKLQNHQQLDMQDVMDLSDKTANVLDVLGQDSGWIIRGGYVSGCVIEYGD